MPLYTVRQLAKLLIMFNEADPEACVSIDSGQLYFTSVALRDNMPEWLSRQLRVMGFCYEVDENGYDYWTNMQEQEA